MGEMELESPPNTDDQREHAQANKELSKPKIAIEPVASP